MRDGNIFHDIPAELPGELAEALIVHPDVTIERIVSKGHSSDPDFWYDQDRNEWVMVIRGEATLRFEKDDRLVHLTEGSWVNIEARERHRVEWTKEETGTVWLAVFY